jgi:outer membrane lipoprotein SlyB
MKKTIVVLSTLLHGCASMSNYTPIVDTFGDSRVQYISADMQECKQLAQQASVAKDALSYGLAGGVAGGAGGAALGAVIGNPAVGAAAGAAGAGIIGGTYGAFQADERYKRIYRQCMRNRQHHVVD